MTSGPHSPRRSGLPLVLVASSLAALGICIVPSAAAIVTFQIANADVSLRPGAPFGAAANAILTAISCTLLSAFLVMLTWWLTLRGRTPNARLLQVVGLVVTALLAVVGALGGLLVIDTMVNT